MKQAELEKLLQWHKGHKVEGLEERRIVLPQILPLLHSLKGRVNMEKAGASHQGRPIYKLRLGHGPNKVLFWTQMHGNESTGTKAFMDLLRFLDQPGPYQELAAFIMERCTLVCLPVLNPDGAEAYTRVNAQGIDLNRDVIGLKAPESRVLQGVLKSFDPSYCFNLHDQRNIFSVGREPKTATISFLAPSEDKERRLTAGRKKTMRLIVAMNRFLQTGLGGHIGRYTDEFYPTATGDNFQKSGYSTVLVESGHYPRDLQREVARKYTFAALVEGLRYIAMGLDDADYREYFDIPDNDKNYLDAIVQNVSVNGEKVSLGILLKELWNGEKLGFLPSLEACGNLEAYRADRIIDGAGLVFDTEANAKKWVENEYN